MRVGVVLQCPFHECIASSVASFRRSLVLVALRARGVSLAQITLQQALALDSIYKKLRSMSDARYTRNRSAREAIEQMRSRLTGDVIIESVSLSVISLICLWFLFSAL